MMWVQESFGGWRTMNGRWFVGERPNKFWSVWQKIGENYHPVGGGFAKADDAKAWADEQDNNKQDKGQK